MNGMYKMSLNLRCNPVLNDMTCFGFDQKLQIRFEDLFHFLRHHEELVHRSLLHHISRQLQLGPIREPINLYDYV